MTGPQQRLYDLVRTEPGITSSHAATLLGSTPASVEAVGQRLKGMGMLEATWNGRTSCWWLPEPQR